MHNKDIALVLLALWAVVGPVWAILFARKNPRISGWIAKDLKAQKGKAVAAAAVEIDELKAKVSELTAKIAGK